ncbi:MAG: GAF domain-containing protein [Spirochaetia bacterium]|nr:GAF domain-containing protein [Spirochaetia bacterium]
MPDSTPDSRALDACYRLLENALHTNSLHEFEEKTLSLLGSGLKAKRLSIILKGQGGFHFAAGESISAPVLKSGKVTVSGNVLAHVLEEGGVVCEDMDSDDRFGKNKKLRYHSKSFVCVPCLDRGHVLGFLSATEPEGKKAFTESDLNFALSLADAFIKGHQAIAKKSDQEKSSAREKASVPIQKSLKGLAVSAGQAGDFSGLFAEAVLRGKESFFLWLADVSHSKGTELGEQKSLFRLASAKAENLTEIKNTFQNYQSHYGSKALPASFVHINVKEKTLRFGVGEFPAVYFSKDTRRLIGLKETSGDKALACKGGDVFILSSADLLAKNKSGWSKDVLLSLLLKKRTSPAENIAATIAKERGEETSLIVLRME